PGNDDAIRAATLMSRIVADAVDEGKRLGQAKGTIVAKPEPKEKEPLTPEQRAEKEAQQRTARDEAAKAQAEREEKLKSSMESAKDWLRKKGLAGAGKRSGRAAEQGAVEVLVENGVGAVAELTAETDFVAKGDEFTSTVAKLAHLAVDNAKAELGALSFEGS